MRKINLADLATLLNYQAEMRVRFTGNVLLMDGRKLNSALPFYNSHGMFELKKLDSAYSLDLVHGSQMPITSQFLFQLDRESRGVEVTSAPDGAYVTLPIAFRLNFRIQPERPEDLELF